MDFDKKQVSIDKDIEYINDESKFYNSDSSLVILFMNILKMMRKKTF